MPDRDETPPEAPRPLERARVPRWFPSLAMTAFAILAVGLLALFTAVQDDGGGGDPPTRELPPPQVLFVGDSYSSAGYAGVTPQDAFPCATAARLGWTCLLDAQGGTGYAADGHALSMSNGSYGQRLPTTVKAYPDPDVVVVSGGRNDDPNLVGGAASLYLAVLRSQYPNAKILVLEPFWIGPADPAITTTRIAVKAASDAAGTTYIPTDTWLPDDTLAPDLVHPTLQGQRDIVDHLQPVLENTL